MTWLWSAVIAHSANAVVFVADKGLLKSDTVMGRPIRYAFFSGVSAGIAVVLFPWVREWPTWFVVNWSIVAGVLHLAALWTFFIILRKRESSRIVPLVGAAVPLWTIVLAAVFLGERLGGMVYLGSLLLVVGGWLLSFSVKHGRLLDTQDWFLIVASGFLFAAYFTVVKHLYDHSPSFMSAFMYGRIIEALLSLFLVWSVFEKGKSKQKIKSKQHKKNLGAGALFVGNKGLAAAAFMLQSYAIRLGSVSVVNALQGVQYLVLLVLVTGASLKWPKTYEEELSRVSLAQKFAGITVVSLGLALLVYA
jgi:drug/metabolite transporter (DMT)-like permease